jgi:hypothetical protein
MGKREEALAGDGTVCSDTPASGPVRVLYGTPVAL